MTRLRTWARALAFSTTLALTFAAHDAASQPATPRVQPLAQTLEGEAKEHYEKARDLYGKGDPGGALASFRRAHELSSDPRLLWNMAACERKLEHFVAVLELVDRYVSEGSALLDDADRREALRVKVAVRAFVASASIATRPEGAEVFVDDRRVGTTPLPGPVLLDPGDHRIRVAKAGFLDATRTESVAGGSEPVWSLALEPETTAEPAASAALPEAKPGPALGEPATTPAPASADADGADASAGAPLWPPILVTSVGAAAAVTGAVLVGVSALEFGRLEDTCAPACDPSRSEEWQTMEVAGDVLLGVGGAVAAAGLIWWIVGSSEASATDRKATARVSSRLSVGPGAVVMELRFH